VPEPAVDATTSSGCSTTTEVVGDGVAAVTENPAIQVVESRTPVAAIGGHGVDARRLPTPLGATEAVLEPSRLLAPPKRAPFEPGKARYTLGAWRIDWATLLKRVYDLDAMACPCGGRLKFVEVVTEADRARPAAQGARIGFPSEVGVRPRSR
jgi:hypothetical protein